MHRNPSHPQQDAITQPFFAGVDLPKAPGECSRRLADVRS
jgi:hypothetical protein